MKWRGQRKFGKNKRINADWRRRTPWKRWLKKYGNKAVRAMERDKIYINDPMRTNDELKGLTKKNASNPWDWD